MPECLRQIREEGESTLRLNPGFAELMARPISKGRKAMAPPIPAAESAPVLASAEIMCLPGNMPYLPVRPAGHVNARTKTGFSRTIARGGATAAR